MISAEEAYGIQAALEGLRLNVEGRLERFKDMPGEAGPPPRVVAVDFLEEQSVYFGSGIDPEIERRIRLLPFEQVFRGDGRLGELLGLRGTEARTEYWTYTLSETGTQPAASGAQRLRSRDERLKRFGNGFFGIGTDEVFAVVVDGRVVAAAASSREDARAAELWVYTRPESRNRGFARQVTAAWLRNAEARGLIPFYSHVRENVASRRLAESLGLALRLRQSCYP